MIYNPYVTHSPYHLKKLNQKKGGKKKLKQKFFQASPTDPENFPFVVIGNKTDVDGGNSRVVRLLLSMS